ncbi:MAG: hypothetical protein FVQ84_19645 [Planctomycetes bacterium]|nr:hypothetical protein [Planctomycetota bacterium]
MTIILNSKSGQPRGIAPTTKNTKGGSRTAPIMITETAYLESIVVKKGNHMGLPLRVENKRWGGPFQLINDYLLLIIWIEDCRPQFSFEFLVLSFELDLSPSDDAG